MRVGVVFKVSEAFVILRNQIFQKQQHIVFDIRVGVFVDGQTARRMLREKNANAVFCFGLAQMFFDFGGDFNHFLAFVRFDIYCLEHREDNISTLFASAIGNYTAADN